jgi:hypothetical protein
VDLEYLGDSFQDHGGCHVRRRFCLASSLEHGTSIDSARAGRRGTLGVLQGGKELPGEFFRTHAPPVVGEDRDVVAWRVIVKTSLASSVMHDLNLSITHRGRNNVGGTVIGGCEPTFVEVEAERLFRWLIHVSSLEFSPAAGTDVLSVDELRCVLLEWSGEDHQANNPADRANFLAKPSNARIASRLMQSSS